MKIFVCLSIHSFFGWLVSQFYLSHSVYLYKIQAHKNKFCFCLFIHSLFVCLVSQFVSFIYCRQCTFIKSKHKKLFVYLFVHSFIYLLSYCVQCSFIKSNMNITIYYTITFVCMFYFILFTYYIKKILKSNIRKNK